MFHDVCTFFWRRSLRGKMQWCSSYFVCWTTFLRTRPWWACRWCKVIWHPHLQCWYKRNDVMQSMKGIWVLLNNYYLSKSHGSWQNCGIIDLIPFKSSFFASTGHNSRRIPSHHNFDFELSRWCHCHPKQEWHACDLSYVMSDVQLVQLFSTEEDAPLKTKMTPSSGGGWKTSHSFKNGSYSGGHVKHC